MRILYRNWSSYTCSRNRTGGWLVIDDIQIPSVYEMFRFLQAEPGIILDEIVVHTAFFRRVEAAQHGPDGWQFQKMNRHTVLRYSWRDRLRRLLGRS